MLRLIDKSRYLTLLLRSTVDFHMDIDLTGIAANSPKSYFVLVPKVDDFENCRGDIIDHLDNTNQVQSEVSINELKEKNTAIKHVFEAATVGSRYGKDLVDFYAEFLSSELKKDDEVPIEERIQSKFNQFGIDASNSGVVGEPINIGINIQERIGEQIDELQSGNVSLTEADLIAALQTVSDRRDIATESQGTVLIKSEMGISELKRYGKIDSLPQILTELMISGLNVVMLLPTTGASDSDVIQDTFRSIGRMEVRHAESIGIEIDDTTSSWVDDWYDELCFDISPGQVSQRTARRAAVAAHNLPDQDVAHHFENAIIDGLQWTYSKQKLSKYEDEFEKLWKNKITPHERYYKYRSKRRNFPRVTVAREDEEKRQFELRFLGPRNKIELNNVPITGPPSEELIDRILSFLNAEYISNDEWEGLLNNTYSSLTNKLDTNKKQLIREALLTQGKLPSYRQGTDSYNDNTEMEVSKEPEWYENNWREILAEPAVRSRAGTNLIADKVELRDSLTGDHLGDSALYYKLEKDINRAKQIYIDDLSDEIDSGTINEIELNVTQEESNQDTLVTYQAKVSDERSQEVQVKINTPYSDVAVSGQPVKPADIDTVASKIIDRLSKIFSQYNPTTSSESILLPLIDLYIDAKGLDQGDLLYFDNFITFSTKLPGIVDYFGGPEDVVENIRDDLSDEQTLCKLREKSSKFHLSGSDPHQGIRTSEGRYVAMELGTHAEDD